MVINSSPKFQLIYFLLFLSVSFAMRGSHAASSRGVPARSSSAIHVPAQERAWKPGDRVEVQWKGDWYQANVIEVKGNQYKIHYDGYDNSWDEWVDNSRTRAAGIKPNKPDNTHQPATASSSFSQVLALLR